MHRRHVIAMQDRFGRTIDYLRISLTDRCNLRCVYCMPEAGVISRPHDEILSFEEIVRVVEVAAQHGIRHLRFTGGEPLVRKGITELVRACKNIEGLEDVALTTNGILLPCFAKELKDAGLSRVNISLDTLDQNVYRAITRCGDLNEAIAGVNCALEAGFSPVKINTVVIRSMNQDLAAFAKLTRDYPLHVRFIEYMPLGSSCSSELIRWSEEEVIPLDEMLRTLTRACVAKDLGAPYPLEPSAQGMTDIIPVGWGPARYWRLPEAQGTIGFITSVSDHFCASCNRLRLTADGKLRLCLFSDQELDVRRALRTGEKRDLDAVFAAALAQKPESHEARTGTLREMVQVGG